MNEKVKLKRPLVVYFLGFGFITGPIFSFFCSLFLYEGRPEFSWQLILRAIHAVPVLDWIWMVLSIIAGCLLFIRIRLSWIFALTILTILILINLYDIYLGLDTKVSSLSFWTLGVFNLAITLVGMVIVSYFRFPYLDRRMPWLNNYVRYDIQQEAQILSPQRLNVVIENISKTGMRLRIKAGKNSKSEICHFERDQNFEIDLKPWVGEAVQAKLIMQQEDICRMKFINLSSTQLVSVEAWIKSLREAA